MTFSDYKPFVTINLSDQRPRHVILDTWFHLELLFLRRIFLDNGKRLVLSYCYSLIVSDEWMLLNTEIVCSIEDWEEQVFTMDIISIRCSMVMKYWND